MDPKTAMYIAQGIHGLAYGMILFLIASGLNIIFGMMGILNLAHASFFMLSAYFSYQFLFMTGNFWAALLLAPLTTAFFGILVERFLLRKVHGLGHMAELILTVGVSLVILAAVKIFWGTESLPVKMPPILEGLISIAGMDYPVYRLFVIGLALASVGCYGLTALQNPFGQNCPRGGLRRGHGRRAGNQHTFGLHARFWHRHMACRSGGSGYCPNLDRVPRIVRPNRHGRFCSGGYGGTWQPFGSVCRGYHIRIAQLLRRSVLLSTRPGTDVSVYGHCPGD